MKRHQLTDEQWALVEPHLPRSKARTGRPPKDLRLMLDGVFWVLHTGAPWRDLPERFGPWQTVYDHFRNWRKSGVFAAIIEALQLKLDKEGYVDWDLVVRGRGARACQPRRRRGRQKSLERHADEPADHALGRGRGGFGSKFHLVTDGAGVPLAVEVTAGQVHESTRFESVVATFIASRRHRRRRRLKPRQLAGDKAYSVRRVRDWLAARGIEAVIPHKDNERARHDPTVRFDRAAYRQRAVVEQCVGWLKECRRIGTRFEKLAVNFHGMLQLAMISRYLKLLFSDRA